MKRRRNRLGVRSAQAQRCRVLDHLVVLLAQQVPADRACQHGLQVGISFRPAGLRAIQLLPRDALQPWQQLEAQQFPESEPNLALAVAIDVVLLHRHLGTVAQDALHHGRDFGGRTALELGIDTDRAFFDAG